MSDLQVLLFGKFEVRHNGTELAGMEGRKTQELLAFLLLHRSRAHAREMLAEMLWGERPGAQTRKYLRQTLWQVQTVLEPCADGGDHGPVVADSEWVQFRCDNGVWLDVAQFEDAFIRARGIVGSDLDDETAQRISAAVQLYRGDLLEGCYQDWCIFERERLQNMNLAMLDKLIDWCQAHQAYETGLGYGDQILRFDRARERTHRRMMRLYYLAGDRTSALRQYEQLVRTLREELNVRPSRRSVALWEQIRTDSFDDDPPSGDNRDRQATTPALAPTDPRSHLRQLHSALVSMQRQIRLEIDAIELALADS